MITFKTIKNLKEKLTKDVQDLCIKHYKTFLRESKDQKGKMHINEQEHSPF